MKKSKIGFGISLLILLLAGCKNNNVTNEGPGELDMASYYIPCKTTYRIAGNSFQMASAFHFKALAQGGLFFPGGGYETFEYQQNGDRITINNGEISWRLRSGDISDFSSTNPHFSATDYALLKIPDSDAFTGNEFTINSHVVSVSHQNGNSSNISSQEFEGLRFADGRFYVTRQGGETNTGSYTLQNNGIATARTGSAGTLWLFVTHNNTLHFSCVYQDRTLYGTFERIR